MTSHLIPANLNCLSAVTITAEITLTTLFIFIFSLKDETTTKTSWPEVITTDITEAVKNHSWASHSIFTFKQYVSQTPF